MSLPNEYIKLLKPKKSKTLINNALKENNHLFTVCEEALCPNRGECFANGTATFLIMGDICTRDCTFCAIKKGLPHVIPPEEKTELLNVIEKMKLDYIVITSVTRDDLSDGGALYFNEIIFAIKKSNPHINIEILVPDFNKNIDNLNKLNYKYFDVFNHNLETIKTLYESIRPKADYDFSLNLLKAAHLKGWITKTGIMVGLGENKEQLKELFDDIANAEIDILTIGQYINPSKKHYRVRKYYLPDEFEELKQMANNAGIKSVISGVFVRSSYKAKRVFKEIL